MGNTLSYRQPTYGPTNKFDEYGNYIGNTVDANQELAEGMYNTDVMGNVVDNNWWDNATGDMTGKDMFGAGFGMANVGLGILNYRDNKKFNKARISGINENIAASREQRQQRRSFLSGTNSAFGA